MPSEEIINYRITCHLDGETWVEWSSTPDPVSFFLDDDDMTFEVQEATEGERLAYQSGLEEGFAFGTGLEKHNAGKRRCGKCSSDGVESA